MNFSLHPKILQSLYFFRMTVDCDTETTMSPLS